MRIHYLIYNVQGCHWGRGRGGFSPAAFIERKKEPKERPNRTGHTAELIVGASVHIAVLNLWPVKKLFIGETGRKLGGRFREHLQDVGRNDNDSSKPLVHQFKFASHSIPGTREADFENTLVSREMKKDVYAKFKGGLKGGWGVGKGVDYGRIWKGE